MMLLVCSALKQNQLNTSSLAVVLLLVYGTGLLMS
jgi:hypothetical protein